MKGEIYAGRSALERIHDLLFGVVNAARPPLEFACSRSSRGLSFRLKISLYPPSRSSTGSTASVFVRGKITAAFPGGEGRPDDPLRPVAARPVNGKVVTLPDGRQILPDQVLDPERPGTFPRDYGYRAYGEPGGILP
jgi:hypothetical protein